MWTSPAAMVLSALLVVFLILVRGCCGDGGTGLAAAADGAGVRLPARESKLEYWPIVPRGQRRPARPAGCCWLLVSCLVSGDIEANPGPADRTRALRVFQQNVCSVKNKLGTLRSHAGEMAAYDAIALTETWLGPQVSDSELQLGLTDHVWF